MAKGDTSTIAEPQGAVVIWNYEDRLGTLGLAAIVNNDEKSSAFPQNINETIILTASLKSITTSKTKKMANGKFEFRLAPTFNWVTRITPGSWCSIIMTRDEHLFPPLNPNALKGKSTRDKFFGKIESVRENVTVSGTGARNTEYIVTGVDWAARHRDCVCILVDDDLLATWLATEACIARAIDLYLLAGWN